MTQDSCLAGLLKPHCIDTNITLSSKKKLLEHTSELLSRASRDAIDKKSVLHLLLDREKLGNTGIGAGVALPHSRCNQISVPSLVLVTLPQSIDYDSLDRQPVEIAFGLLVPENAEQQHLALLGQIAHMMTLQQRRQQLLQQSQAEGVISLLQQWQLHQGAQE